MKHLSETMKKHLALVLVLLLVFSTALPVSAVNLPDNEPTEEILLSGEKTISSVQPQDDDPEYPPEYPPENPPEEEETDQPVAEMYVCAKRQITLLGHMWIYIENLSDHELQVGAYTLPPNEGVSIGVFALTRRDGWGVYYNVESYCVNKYGVSNVIVMHRSLNEEQMADVSRRISNSNYWEMIIFNCMWFAFHTWNTDTWNILLPLAFPILGRFQMLLHQHESEITMFFPTVDRVYKQKGLGDNARLVPVSADSLDHGI